MRSVEQRVSVWLLKSGELPETRAGWASVTTAFYTQRSRLPEQTPSLWCDPCVERISCGQGLAWGVERGDRTGAGGVGKLFEATNFRFGWFQVWLGLGVGWWFTSCPVEGAGPRGGDGWWGGVCGTVCTVMVPAQWGVVLRTGKSK